MNATRRYNCKFYGECLDAAAWVSGSLECVDCHRFIEVVPEGEPDSFFEDLSGGRNMTEEHAVYGKPDQDATLKRCTMCKKEKPLKEFSKSKQGKFGRKSTCKACDSAYAASRYASGLIKKSKKKQLEEKAPAVPEPIDRMEAAVGILRAITNAVSENAKGDLVQPKVLAAIYEELGREERILS